MATGAPCCPIFSNDVLNLKGTGIYEEICYVEEVNFCYKHHSVKLKFKINRDLQYTMQVNSKYVLQAKLVCLKNDEIWIHPLSSTNLWYYLLVTVNK